MTHKRVVELFDYDRVTGLFTRKISTSNRTKIGSVVSSKCNGYYMTQIDGERIYLHRLAWFYEYGIMPNFIDHIDGNTLNNSISNLRNVSKKVNHKNMKKPKTNTSGVVGVYYNVKNNKWIANICIDKKTIYIGSFDCFDDAVIARKKAEKNNGFHFNHGR